MCKFNIIKIKEKQRQIAYESFSIPHSSSCALGKECSCCDAGDGPSVPNQLDLEKGDIEEKEEKEEKEEEEEEEEVFLTPLQIYQKNYQKNRSNIQVKAKRSNDEKEEEEEEVLDT